MKYLDYQLLEDSYLDPVIRRLLVTICVTSSIRRVQTAFPEFFSDRTPYKNREVRLADMAARYEALHSLHDFEADDEMREITEWFGIPLYIWEGREDGVQTDECIIISSDFSIERDSDYNGLTDTNPWIVSLSANEGKDPEDHLVLKFVHIGDRNPEFFMWTISVRNIARSVELD